jgi:branched-chain amino acid aminotransferase
MAAGTAAALVPIRSITRRMDASHPQSLATSVKEHPRLSFKDGEETITYIPDSQEDAGPLCIKLLTQLKGIQQGKVKDDFGWCFKVEETDGKKVVPDQSLDHNRNGQTVDQLD